LDQPTIAAVAAVAGVGITAASSYVAYSKGVKKESAQEGREKGKIEANLKTMEENCANMRTMENHMTNMQTNIGYIMKQNDNLLFEQREANKNHNALAERVTRVEESSKQAHLGINTIEERVDKL
jgi:hypothetical protein